MLNIKKKNRNKRTAQLSTEALSHNRVLGCLRSDLVLKPYVLEAIFQGNIPNYFQSTKLLLFCLLLLVDKT